MTVLNDLRRRAEAVPPPREVTITSNHLGTLIEHIRATSSRQSGLGALSRKDLERALYDGDVKIAGVKIRVIGAPLRDEIEDLQRAWSNLLAAIVRELGLLPWIDRLNSFAKRIGF